MGVLLKTSRRDTPLLCSRSCELAVIGAVLGYFAFSPRLLDIPLCLTAYFTAVTCPTCGTTRAVWHILHGQFAHAWAFNPIGFLVVLALARRAFVLSFPGNSVSHLLQRESVSLSLFATFLLLGFLRSFNLLAV